MDGKKIIIKYNSKGPGGNIFALLAAVRTELRKQHRITEFNDLWEKVGNSHSYEEALKHIGEKAELIDTSCIKKT